MADVEPFHPVHALKWTEGAEARNIGSLIAMMLIGLDAIATFPMAECKFLLVGKRSVIKGLYFALRYSSLFGQIANFAILCQLYTAEPLEETACKHLFLFQSILLQALFTFAKAILYIRMTALFDQDHRVKSVLKFMFACEYAFVSYANVRLNLGLRYDQNCLPTYIPDEVWLLSAIMVLAVVIHWSLCLYKQHKLCRDCPNGIPVLNVMIRDDGGAVIAYTVFFGFTVPFSYFSHAMSQIPISIIILIISKVGSRSIMNMRSINPQSASSYGEGSAEAGSTSFTNIESDIVSAFQARSIIGSFDGGQ